MPTVRAQRQAKRKQGPARTILIGRSSEPYDPGNKPSKNWDQKTAPNRAHLSISTCVKRRGDVQGSVPQRSRKFSPVRRWARPGSRNCS